MSLKMEQKWAKGLQQQGKGWSIGFQIKGKRQSMTVYCSQAEAAVIYDLAAIWANKQKGNNPDNSTYYNFSVLWYPREYVAHMMELPDFAAVKEYTAQLLADGTAERLVPFDGVERMHRIRPSDTWKAHRELELGVNSRGLHFFSGSFWNCVLMEDVESFGAEGRSLQLTYRGHVNVLADRSRQNALSTHHYKSDAAMDVYADLQQAVQQAQEEGGGHIPRDLGPNIDLQLESAGSSDVEESTKRSARRRSAAATHYTDDLDMAEWSEEEGAGAESEPPTPAAARGISGRGAGRGGRGARGGRGTRGRGRAGGGRKAPLAATALNGSESWEWANGSSYAPPRPPPVHGGYPGEYDGEHEEEDEEQNLRQGLQHGGGYYSGAEGPSKDELDLFRDFASIAAGTSVPKHGQQQKQHQQQHEEEQPWDGEEAEEGDGWEEQEECGIAEEEDGGEWRPGGGRWGGAGGRRGGRGGRGGRGRAACELPATAPARLPPTGWHSQLVPGRKRRALSEPVSHRNPGHSPPHHAEHTVAAAELEETAPLFNHIPRRRRTESFVRSTNRPTGGESAVSPMQQGSSEHRGGATATATASLQTSQQHARAQHTAQSRDVGWRGEGGAPSGLEWAPLKEEDEGEDEEVEGQQQAKQQQQAQMEQVEEAEGEAGTVETPLAAAEQGCSIKQEHQQGEQEEEEDAEQGISAAPATAEGSSRQQGKVEGECEQQGEQQQSSGYRQGAAASSAPPATSQQAHERPRQRKQQSRKSTPEVMQLGSYPMAMQQPFMPMMHPAMMGGMRPAMMAAAGAPGQPAAAGFYCMPAPYMFATPGGLMVAGGMPGGFMAAGAAPAPAAAASPGGGKAASGSGEQSATATAAAGARSAAAPAAAVPVAPAAAAVGPAGFMMPPRGPAGMQMPFMMPSGTGVSAAGMQAAGMQAAGMQFPAGYGFGGGMMVPMVLAPPPAMQVQMAALQSGGPAKA